MVELFKKLHEKATEFADIMLVDVIDDVDLLTVALCAGNFNEIVRTIYKTREGECGHIAAHRALDIGWNPSLRESKAKEGFFSKGLRGLIELSKNNPDTGARLMPVLGSMISEYQELDISEKLKREVMCYMEYMHQRDGFAISHISDDGKVIVKPAKGLFDD